MLYRKTPPPFHPFSCRHLYVRRWTAPWLGLQRALSIETGCETRFATLAPTAPPTDTPAGASSPNEHTYFGVRSARRNLTLGRHLRETRGGKSHTRDKGNAICTHAYTHPVQSKVHHCNQISNSIRSNQIQSTSIKFYQGNPPACYPSWDRGQAR